MYINIFAFFSVRSLYFFVYLQLYNIMLTNDVDLKRQLRQICRRQSYTFSVNASVGLLLQNSSTNQIAYYTAYNTAESNTSHVYVEPIKVLSPTAIDEVLVKFGIPELTAHATIAPQSSP